jgi:uncharacterized protein YutE (UPF0331/DUF86 family)
VVDKVLLLRKLSELEEYLEQIKEYVNVTVEQYSKDWRIQRIVERTLQMMIELCADIVGHIISDRGYRVPTSYADTFTVLYEKEIFAKDLFETMEKMSKFRNIIVHHYDRIAPEIVVNILRKDLNDFLAFKNLIIHLLSQ